MAAKRCIMIFPELNNIQKINQIRAAYDPLANHVKPHITLVFPFESNLDTSQLRAHLEKILSAINPFRLVLKNITPAKSDFGNYLFLNVHEGKDIIESLHQKFYQGILEDYKPSWLATNNYEPHMTLGVIENEIEFTKIAEKLSLIEESFTTTVDKISVEIIDANEDSIIEMEVDL